VTKYYSRSKQKFIDIATMTDQYVRYALIQKCKHEPTEDVMFAQQQVERATRLEEEKISMGYKISEYKDRIISLENSIRKLKLENTRLVDRLERDDHGVGEIERQRDDAIFDLKQERNRAMMYAEMLNDKCPNGHAYVFSEIPNDDEGREFVQKMKGYLNKESYKIRVRGQYLDDETKQTEGIDRHWPHWH